MPTELSVQWMEEKYPWTTSPSLPVTLCIFAFRQVLKEQLPPVFFIPVLHDESL